MVDQDVLVRTRLGLQAVAEHVLSAALHQATGRIGLRPNPGGFATPAFPVPGGERRLAVVGLDLVVQDPAGDRREPLTTVAAAAALAGVAPGAPREVYEPSTPLAPDAPLALDLGAAMELADWFALVGTTLSAICLEHADAEPAPVQLWPEHFDLATTISEVNLGGSPGDDGHPEPYLYVGPWAPQQGPFWNEPFGASVDRADVGDPESALGWLRRGFHLATS